MAREKIVLWATVQMYCPNCGTLNVGYEDSNGKHRFQCKRCAVVMVRSYKNRRHDLIELTVPQEKGRLSI